MLYLPYSCLCIEGLFLEMFRKLHGVPRTEPRSAICKSYLLYYLSSPEIFFYFFSNFFLLFSFHLFKKMESILGKWFKVREHILCILEPVDRYLVVHSPLSINRSDPSPLSYFETWLVLKHLQIWPNAKT